MIFRDKGLLLFTSYKASYETLDEDSVLPEWEELPEESKQIWRVAADAFVNAIAQ